MSYDTQRELTEEEQQELDALNQAIGDAITKRSEWLDAKMYETSKLQVGDDIYDIRSGSKLGTVTGLYRYWQNRNDLLDDGHYCHYRYRTGQGNDNTSSQLGRWFGTRENAIDYAEMKLSMVRGKEIS